MRSTTLPSGRGLRLLAVLVIAFLAACAPEYRNHGYIPREADLARIEVGDNRQEVATLIGRPSVTGLLEDDAWFYVRSRYRDYAWRAPAEIDREVLVISFSGDRVTNIERYGLRDGQVVTLSRRVTNQSTANVPFLRQIFGNVGNFNPAGLFDGQ